MTVRFSVTVRQVREDGSEARLDGELAAALAGPAEQFAGDGWPGRRGEARRLDHGEREKAIAESGPGAAAAAAGGHVRHRLPRGRSGSRQVTSAAGIRHGSVEKGHDRGVVSIFGPVRVDAAGLPQPARGEPVPGRRAVGAARGPVLAGDARPGRPITWPRAGYGQAQEVIEARTGVTDRPRPAGRASPRTSPPGPVTSTSSGPATRTPDLPGSDVIMMQADGKGIAHAPRAPQERRQGADAAHPGIKKMAEIVAVADFTPAVREPGGHRRPARPPQGAPRPRGPGQMGRGLGHRDHRGHDRRPRSTRPTAATRSGSGSGCSSSTGTSSRSPPSRPTRENAA